MANPQMQWLSLNNFSPGIVQNLAYHSVGTPDGYGPGAQGAASLEDTFACIALPQGGLGPLPRRDFTYTCPRFGSANVEYGIQFMAYGPVFMVDSASFPGNNTFWYPAQDVRDYANNNHLVEFHFWTEHVTGGNRIGEWQQHRVYDVGQTVTASEVATLKTSSGTDRATSTTKHGPGFFAVQRITIAGNKGQGRAIIAGSWNEPVDDDGTAGASRFIASLHPDPDDPHTNATADFSGLAGGGALTAHQHRILINILSGTRHGVGVGAGGVDFPYSRTFEYINWTRPNSIVLEGGSAVYSSFTLGPEFPVGLGVVASTSAGELLLIKHSGGAYLVQGDLNYPNVRRLPGVAATEGVMCDAAQTSAGLVYGVNRGGVHAWSGGEGSENISAQLPPDFWMTAQADSILDYKGNFVQWRDLIVAPNGFLYDPSQGGWWRLDDPDTYTPYMYAVNPANGYLYGCEATNTASGTTQTGFLWGWNPALGADQYSWRSQPLWLDPSRRITIRELVLVCQGQGTVTVTMEDLTGTPVTETFTLSGATDEPQVIRKVTAARDLSGARLRIQANSGSSSVAAPVAHELRVGWQGAEQTTTS